jgi:hypothetical protein
MAPAPWGEHAGNELLSVASALIYANAGQPDETYARQLSTRARALVANLVASQAKDGSWASPANAHLTTARAYWALIQARKAGLAIHKDTIEKAAAYLQKQFESADSNDADTKAVILHALSTDKRADFANCNRLYRERNTLSNASLAFLASAFFNLERKEIALACRGIADRRVDEEARTFLVVECEMLDRGDHVLALDAADCIAAQQPRQQGIFPGIFECAAITRFAHQVDPARKEDVEPLAPRFIP